jgi:hypothetical protein
LPNETGAGRAPATHRIVVEILLGRQIELVVHPLVIRGVKQVLLLRHAPAAKGAGLGSDYSCKLH